MRTKILVGVTMALGVIIFLIANGERENQEAAREIVRRQNQYQANDETPAADQAIQQTMFQLTSLLSANWVPGQNTWVVEDSLSSATVELPFKPSREGDFLNDSHSVEASVQSEAQRASPFADSGYMGAQVCAQCHQEKHSGFVHTAHHKTSGLVNEKSAIGSFSPPKNQIKTYDPRLSIELETIAGKYFQEVTFEDWVLKVPMDVVTGSGKTGQTFLYWHDEALFQAYVSYLSDLDNWIPSPGFENHVTYSRPIRTACLECHITYIAEKQAPNIYHRDSAIWGISCERCHSPGRNHVEYHQANPNEKKAKFITQPNALSRQAQLDLCGQCHSGTFKLIGEAFSYRPGDDLSKHHRHRPIEAKESGGIHTSNQLTRLSLSKCFQGSEMTCTTCHDPHQNERGDAKVFTARCVSCHEPMDCGMSNQLAESELTQGCVSCHMPMGENEGMQLQASNGNFTVQMIDHYIRIDKFAAEHHLSK